MANQPNLYHLSGKGIQVTYSTTSISGKPLFNYHEGAVVKNFSGDEIQTAETILGNLVTVFIVRTVDTGSTTFTLLIPSINLPASNSAHIATEGITTLHKFSIVGPHTGQREFYTVHPLQGTASFVQF
jgi:hypothetical protein